MHQPPEFGSVDISRDIAAHAWAGVIDPSRPGQVHMGCLPSERTLSASVQLEPGFGAKPHTSQSTAVFSGFPYK